MGEWLGANWYQIGVLIGLAIIARNTATIAWNSGAVINHFKSAEADLSQLSSDVSKWELAWRVTDERGSWRAKVPDVDP